MSVQIFCLFLNARLFVFPLSFERSRHARYKCLPGASLGNISSQCVVCVFIFLTVFQRASVLNFDGVHFINFFLYGSCFGGSYLRNLYLAQGHKDFLLYFRRKTYANIVVWGCTFRSVIHFELLFCIWRRIRTEGHFFACLHLVVPAIVENICFFLLSCLHTFVKY